MIGGMYLKGVDADGRFEARHEAASCKGKYFDW
jgi:hypothetical protein